MGESFEEDNILPLVKNNKVKLRQSSEPVTEDDDWKGLKDLLYSNLAHYGGIGLSAVQLGIYKSACVVNVKEPIFLVNPEIVDAQGNTKYVEGCLSFPNDVVATERYTEILVEADNFDQRLHFAPDDEDLIPASYEDNMEMEDDEGLLECVAVQHECLPRSSKITTKDGKKRIKDIVDNEYDGKVLSYNLKYKKLEWKSITGWNSKKNKRKKKWVTVRTIKGNGPIKQTVSTEDHMIAVCSNPFDLDNINYVEAKNTLGKYVVRKVDNDREKNKERALYNDEQLSIIYGSLLGDMCISSRGSIACNHGESQSEYSKWKANLLGGWVDKVKGAGYNPNTPNVCCKSPVTEQTKLLREESYKESGKVVTDRVLSGFDKISLSFWYMDDGGYHKNKKFSTFHVESFSKEDKQKLSELLKTRFGIENNIINRSGNYKIINLTKKSTDKLHQIVYPYIHESMEHKLNKKYRGRKKYSFNLEKKDISLRKVINIHYHKTLQSKLYDIKVKDNNNFFANGSLVHNCDHTNGTLFFDRRAERGETYEKEKTQDIGRNDRVRVRNEDGVVSTVKYKHVSDQIENQNIELLEVVN